VVNAVFGELGARAIKLPRVGTPVTGKSDEDPFVDPELHALSKVSHQNITRLYDAFRLKNGGVCTITEYVENAQALDRFAGSICCTEECREKEIALLKATRSLAEIIYEIADALVYMHDSANLIHSDINPRQHFGRRIAPSIYYRFGFRPRTIRIAGDSCATLRVGQ
jgi:serine/threonine protein kinase